MNKKLKLTGVVLAIGAATVFTLAPAVAVAKSKTVDCYGINSCKGKGTCKTASNSCKGKNDCKGKGVVKVSEKACKKKGGTVQTQAQTQTQTQTETTTS